MHDALKILGYMLKSFTSYRSIFYILILPPHIIVSFRIHECICVFKNNIFVGDFGEGKHQSGFLALQMYEE